eukprot:Clim_evm74s134 gene=Clim_evmTU74s134
MSHLVPTVKFALVVVRHPTSKRYVAVEETQNRGWWLPGGKVDPGETFAIAACRETMEEAGIEVRLKGVLRVEHSPGPDFDRMRMIFLGEPVDPECQLKSVADEESLQAKWVDLAELQDMHEKRSMRGKELLQWATYLEQGGEVYPMRLLASEIDPVRP